MTYKPLRPINRWHKFSVFGGLNHPAHPVNTCLGDLRKSKKFVPINEAVLETGATDGKSDKREAQIKRMYQCIDKLSPTNKAIILLELEEVPQAAIAEMQGIAHGALRTRLSRIRNSLLKCITNEKR